MDLPNIEIFPWNENFATGIPDIDQQHKTLIGLINQLVSHLAYQSDAPTLNAIFDQLTAYAARHFTFEETIWHQYLPEDPWETWHVHAHASFVDEVNRLMAQGDSKSLDEVIEEIVAFLTRWLAFHILESDRRLAKVVLALPSGMSLAQAKEVANNEMAGATKLLIDTVMTMYENLANRTVQLTREMNRRRAAEQELRVANLVYQYSSEAMAVLDAENWILATNPAFTALTGYSQAEALGQGLDLLGPGYAESNFSEAIQRAGAESSLWEGEIWHRHKHGEDYPVWLTLNTVLDHHDRVHRRVALFRDITQRKRRGEEIMLARQLAEAANRAKSELLVNMSHEIRIPMNAIIGLTQILYRDAKEEKSRSRLLKIGESARHLFNILDEMLDLSRIKDGKLRLVEEEFELPELLEQVLAWVSASAEIKGLELGIDMEPSLRKPFRGDPLRLRQILLNLIDNALKYTELGHIRMRVRRVEDSARDCLLRFEIEDTGIGIAPADQSGLFERFDGTPASNSFRYGGKGLGLSIARQFTQLMGGTIGVNSQPGVGSVFWFTARLEKIEPGAEALAAPPQPSLDDLEATLARDFSRARILLVEDSPTGQDIMREPLVRAGLRVDVADNGREAVALARMIDYDLILMDLQMPLMSGLDATRAIRAQPGRETIPIIAITVRTTEEDRLASLAAGMSDHIPKPVEPTTLYTALLRWLPNSLDLAGKTRPAPPASQTVGAESAIPTTRRTSATILCVDDEPINLDVLRETLQQDYVLIFTRNGRDALRAARKHRPALILLDIQMPDMDGYEVCRRLKAEPATEDIPVIFVTSQSEQVNEKAGFDVGGVDYITKPITPLILQARVRNQLSLVRSSRLESSYRDAIYMLAEAGHYNDSDTGAHIWRMAAYSRALAEALGWSNERCELLELAATMHDTGKIGISDSILKKPGKLDVEEFAVMKTHSRIGFGILSRSHAPVFQLAAEIALHHHERWDGGGYPAGLSGEAIPESARIVAIADVFDALSMRRPYKEPWPLNRILTHMRDNSGSHFDPRLLQVFMDIMPTLMSLRDLWEKED